MSIVSTLADGAIAILQKFATKSTVIANIDGIAVTAGGLESAASTITGFLSAFQAAVKTKNYALEAELGIDEALVIAADLGVPYAGIAAQVLPFVFDLINSGQLPASSLFGSLSDNAGERQSQIIADRFGR